MPEDLFDQLLLFQDLSPAQREILRPLFTPYARLAGELIFEQGDPAEYLYVLVHGEVTVRFKPEDGPALIVARVRPEGVAGWSAALGSTHYTSGAVCATDCIMLRVSGDDLRALCEQHPDTGALVLERLAIVIAERLRNTYDHVITLLEYGLRNGVKAPSAH